MALNALPAAAKHLPRVCCCRTAAPQQRQEQQQHYATACAHLQLLQLINRLVLGAIGTKQATHSLQRGEPSARLS